MKAKYTDNQIWHIVGQYDEIASFRNDHPKLYNALIARKEKGKIFMEHMKRGKWLRKPCPEKSESTTKDGSPKPSHLFPAIWKGETKHCGRCFRADIKWSNRTNLCKDCSNRVNSLTIQNKELNPWNVRDQFAGSTIRHYEKTFEIGLHAPDKLKGYLTLVGYGFIFKEIYDEKHLQSVLTPG